MISNKHFKITTMHAISQQEWQDLPESAQKKIYELFSALKKTKTDSVSLDSNETALLSEKALSDWSIKEEDDTWKKFQ